jgi:hypothetical protein
MLVSGQGEAASLSFAHKRWSQENRRRFHQSAPEVQAELTIPRRQLASSPLFLRIVAS